MPKIKGPKNGVLKLNFNGPAKMMPGTKKALMLLSIKNNELCTGGYLELSLKQATDATNPENKIRSITLLIADEIYWHNLAKSATDSVENRDQLKTEALSLGENYFKDNLSAFLSPFDKETHIKLALACENKTVNEQISIINQLAATLPIPFEIQRWSTWVSQKTQKGIPYTTIQKSMEQIYLEEPSLITSIDATSNAFARRHIKEANPELLLLRSKGYLTEESPAVMWLGAELGYNFVIYAGGIIPSFTATKEYFVVDAKNQELTKRPFAIAVEDPKKFVNWLEAHYKRVAPPKVTEKPVEILPIAPLHPAGKITPEMAKAVLSPLTSAKVYNFGIFPPSPRERKSRPHSFPASIDTEKNVLKKQAERPTKKTSSLEDQLNPILLKAIMTIAQTLTDLPTEKERKTVMDLMTSAFFAELLCASKGEKLSHEVTTQLRMS